MIGQYTLSLRRKYKLREPVGVGRSTDDDREPVVVADGERIGQRDELLAGIFLRRDARVRAVGEEDVCLAIGDERTIGVAAGRAGRGIRRAGELQRLLLKLREGPGLEFFGFLKNLPGVV